LGGSAKESQDFQFMVISLQSEGGRKRPKPALFSPLLCCVAVEESKVGAALWWAGITSVDSPLGMSMVTRSHNCLVFLYLTNDLSLQKMGPFAWEPGGVLKQRKFQLKMRKNFFPLRVTEPWPRLPREAVESPSLEMFKTHLDWVLCSLL